uniref:Uncharacterized protein n=1 Tax=Heterorhabditis bacteriophora TaxID=37862 RepID=A0A1I7WFB4_HETBA
MPNELLPKIRNQTSKKLRNFRGQGYTTFKIMNGHYKKIKKHVYIYNIIIVPECVKTACFVSHNDEYCIFEFEKLII